MKKILFLHNRYLEPGGEDVAVQNEIDFLKKFYKVDVLYFQNNTKNIFFIVLSLIFVNNIFSNKKISKKIKSFQPDLVYVHNTWFKLSLGFVNIIKKESIPILFKIHNFRLAARILLVLRNTLMVKSIVMPVD